MGNCNSNTTKNKKCFVTRPELQVIFAEHMIPYLDNPGPLRITCKYMQACWNTSLLNPEVESSCPYIMPLLKDVQEASAGGEQGKQQSDNESAVSQQVSQRTGSSALPVAWAALQSSGMAFKLRDYNVLTQLYIEDIPGMKSIGDTRLHFPSCITVVTVRGLKNLETIGNEFLGWIDAEEITISDLPQLRSVGDSWLRGCVKAKKIHVTNIPQLQRIGTNFVDYCKQLEDFKLEGLDSLQSIGEHWLNSADNLKVLAITDLPRLSELGWSPVNRCHNLHQVTFERLPSLRRVGDGWLCGATMLKTLRLADLPNLKDPGIGPTCLRECYCLKEVDIVADSCNSNLVTAIEKTYLAKK